MKLSVVCGLGCAVLTGSLVFSAAGALASGGEPTIGNVTATNVTEHGATLEAQINPEGSETTFEAWIQCERPSSGGVPCEAAAVSPLGQGHLASGSGAETVRGGLTGLQPGYFYTYWFVATNVAGRTEGRHRPLETQALGACGHLGCPYKVELPEWLEIQSEEKSKQTLKEYEAKHAKELEAQHAKEREEQVSREAAARTAQALAAKEREESEQDHGGLSLAGTSITVQRNGDALVRLTCLGIASCGGQLTLTATSVAGAKGKHRTRTLTIGTVSFSIPGDETKTVGVELNATGRALLRMDRERLTARLSVLESAPTPGRTLTKGVRLVQRQTRGTRTGEQ